MKQNKIRGLEPFSDPLDALLADIAINIQLPPGLHEQATDRYEAVRRYIERRGSPLENLVLRFYPQGSMAIDATISTRGTDDQYDLDIVAELDIDPHAEPDAVLRTLQESLKDYPVTRIERQTRCVTLYYADGMHLDVTPSARLAGSNDRESHIFHAKPSKPGDQYHVPMNAWGFCRWYSVRTPIEPRFAKAFNRRLLDAYGYSVNADAEVDDVPDQCPLTVKSTATVALQLLKRFRNITYADYAGRIPPSVMMSYFAGQASRPGVGLAEMVILQCRAIALALRQASSRRAKVMVCNPVFGSDVFTDRWPESVAQQEEFAYRLMDLAEGLEAIRRGDHSLEAVQDWLRDRFGERVVTRSIKLMNDRTGRAVRLAQQSYTPKGGLYVPAAPAIVVSAPAAARQHTFMGGRRR